MRKLLDMKTSTAILALAAAALAFVSCGGKQNSQGDGTNGDKLVHSPEANEVSVMVLRSQPFNLQMVSNGKLSAAGRSELYFENVGTITEMNVANGDRVSSGAILARIDDGRQANDVRSAEIALEKARMSLYDELIGLGYEARDTVSVPLDVMATARMKSGFLEAENTLEKARNELAATVLRAPFSGRVADVKLKKYDRTGSEPFCTIIDDSSFDVDFNVLESEYGFLGKDLPVKVSPFGSEKSLSGRVTTINPAVDKNGQVGVRARIANDGTLVDGMNVRVVVEKAENDRLVVPKSAVVIRDGLDVLFRYRGGKAEWVYVNVLMSNAESYAVVANRDRGAELFPGDSVIVSGNLNLADGSQVTLREE